MASPLLEALGDRLHAAWDDLTGTRHGQNPHLPAPPPSSAPLKPTDILTHPTEEEFKAGLAPKKIGDAPLPSFDPGVFNNELLSLKLFAKPDPKDPTKAVDPEGNITEGTYAGTQVALTQVYGRIEQIYSTYLDVLAIEPSFPRYIGLKDKQKMYQWSTYPDKGNPETYPPHLETIPPGQKESTLAIFNALGLAETLVIVKLITPDEDGFLNKTKKWLVEKARAGAYGGNPQAGLTIDDVVEYNKYHRKIGPDISNGGNLGLLDDWYSDRRYADQSFTGVNPTTIERCSDRWLGEFVAAAKDNGEAKWEALLSSADRASLFVQDCSYFRAAFGIADPAATMHHKQATSDDNWAVGAVSLFQLHDDGQLHPVAIVVDYKGSMAASVVVFNKRRSPADPTAGEKDDWPWRYAKTAAQSSDWMRHEVGVHLTRAHLVEEATIVAANRALPMEHPVYRLLSPHWYKTLSLNAAARSVLVPQVIVEIVGASPEQCYSYCRYEYEHFDFQRSYVPRDLDARGFPNTEAGLAAPRFRNYAYAKNILALWGAIRRYVASMLALHYGDGDKAKADAAVAADPHVQKWADECRGPGHILNFPATFATLDALVDAVTMCIHIAAPFHSAVNYLQNFYLVFVPAKPPMLCRAPPSTLAELSKYREPDMVASLPINRQREWLLAAQVPWLLSFRVDDDRSLLNYAASVWNVYKYKKDPKDQQVKNISEAFYSDLLRLQVQFFNNSKAMSEGSIPYMVLDPGLTAVSILI